MVERLDFEFFLHTTLHASENSGMFWLSEICGNLATEISKPRCDWSVSGNRMPSSVQQMFVAMENGTDTKKGYKEARYADIYRLSKSIW